MPAPKDPIKYAEFCRKISEAGKNVSEETRLKRSIALKGKPRSEETKRKISEGQLGKKRPGYNERLSDETRLKLSLASKGKKRTEENCRKISEALKGRKMPEATRLKMIASRMGQPSNRKGVSLSDETKEKLRAAHTGKKASPETRIKMIDVRCGGIWYGNVNYDTDHFPYCEKWTHAFRERVRAFFDYTCQFPGCNHVWQEGEKRLAVHHINYRKDSCCNANVRPLFIPLCPGACHAKTNNDRKRWETYFTELIDDEFDGECYLTKEEMKNLQENK